MCLALRAKQASRAYQTAHNGGHEIFCCYLMAFTCLSIEATGAWFSGGFSTARQSQHDEVLPRTGSRSPDPLPWPPGETRSRPLMEAELGSRLRGRDVTPGLHHAQMRAEAPVQGLPLCFWVRSGPGAPTKQMKFNNKTAGERPETGDNGQWFSFPRHQKRCRQRICHDKLSDPWRPSQTLERFWMSSPCLGGSCGSKVPTRKLGTS